MGGKFYAVDALYSFLPADFSEKYYVVGEPFGGGGTFTLNFPEEFTRDRVFVYNDIDGSISALFYVLAVPELFYKFIDFARWSIRSYLCFKGSVARSNVISETLTAEDFANNNEEKILNAAVLALMSLRMSFAGRALKKNHSFARQTKKTALKKYAETSASKKRVCPTDKLVLAFSKIQTGSTKMVLELLPDDIADWTGDELRRVLEPFRRRLTTPGFHVESCDFEKVFKNYGSERSFFYLDPPYYGLESYYRKTFDEKDHERLLNRLKNFEGAFLLSYNAHEWVIDSYQEAGFHVWTELNGGWRYSAGSGDVRSRNATDHEVFITNYDNPRAVIGNRRQVTFLG